ncbi:hypothetical protein Tco_1568788 [Tanacetum coccineum]
MMLMIQCKAKANIFCFSFPNAFTKHYSTPTNNNQRISTNTCNKKISQLRMNINQGRNRNQIVGNLQGNVAAPVVGNNRNGHKVNQIRSYNCRVIQDLGILRASQEPFDAIEA